MLGEEFELGILWDEYGIVGDVMVKFPYSYILIITYYFMFLAIYKCFSMSRYSCPVKTGPGLSEINLDKSMWEFFFDYH